MKLYNKLRNLKTSTKVGLVSTGIYAASTLAIPAYAVVKQEKPETTVVQPVNLENISTVEEANKLFHTKLKEYCFDKELNSEEVKSLSSILLKEKCLLDEGKSIVDSKYLEAKKEVNVISQRRTKLEEELQQLKAPDAIFLDYLSENKEKLESSLKELFPGILDKQDTDLNISYPADMKIEDSNLKSLIQTVTKDVHYKLSSEYSDSVLELVSGKNREDFKLRDVALLLKVMGTYEARLKKSRDIAKKELLKQEIEGLKLQEETIWKKTLTSEEKETIDVYLRSQINIAETLRKFSDYTSFEIKAKGFMEKFGDWNKYWCGSVVAEIMTEKKAPHLYTPLNKDNQRSIENAIDEFIELAGLEAKVKPLKNPRMYKFPLWWCIAINGFAMPLVRNILIRKYIGRMDEYGEPYFLSGVAAIFNGGIGVLLTDGLHPLAFWARMATPVVIQPLKKWFDVTW